MRTSEAICLGLDERRQLADLLKPTQEVPENYEDLTSQPESAPQMEIPTKASREPKDVGMETTEKMPPPERARETELLADVGRATNNHP